MKRVAISLMLVALLAVACAPPAQPAPTATPAPTQPEPTQPAATPPPPTSAPTVEPSPAQAAAVAMLAEALGLSPDQITLDSAEAVDWPDACLGIAYPNVRCAQGVTPGFRLVLEAGGARYEYHTNGDGSAVAATVPSLSWHRQGGIVGFCDDLFISGFGPAQASSCRTGEIYPDGTLTESEQAQLTRWAGAFGSVIIEAGDPVAADSMSFILILAGTGTGQPSDAEKQAMLDWAQAVYERLRP